MEFLKTLILSPTFLRAMGELMVIFFAALLVVVFIVRFFNKRSALPAVFRRDIAGSANAADFVLTVPVFVSVISIFVQLALIANASLIVHYAAYSAARSARVYYWDVDIISEKAINYIVRKTPALYAGSLMALNSNKAAVAATNAANFVLIAASPSSARVSAAGVPPHKILTRLSQIYLSDQRKAALLRKARYAYDRANSKVEIDAAFIAKPFPYALDLKNYAEAWPITATVRYRKYLGVPLASLLLGKKEGGSYYRWLHAEVTLL